MGKPSALTNLVTESPTVPLVVVVFAVLFVAVQVGLGLWQPVRAMVTASPPWSGRFVARPLRPAASNCRSALLPCSSVLAR